MRQTYLLVILLIICTTTKAQKEELTVGFRGGYSWGPTISLSDGYRGVKGLLSFRENGLQATALYTISKPIENKYRFDLFFYYGIGVHTGFIRKGKYNHDKDNYYKNYFRKIDPIVGFDGLIGVEYRFYTFPLTIALDFKPYMEFFGKHFFNINLYDFGLTLKYRIN